MVQAHDHVGCETCLDALIELEARVDALPGKRAASAQARKRDEAYRAMRDALKEMVDATGGDYPCAVERGYCTNHFGGVNRMNACPIPDARAALRRSDGIR